ncbi:DoxX family protein [Tabrizicola sp.]|uniref:DoxX family protein n=1 Tax=Tabrizicola sp. TaxID=2005166 RepID=UPI003F2F090E
MIEDRFAPYAATLLRLSLGVMLLAHGLMKVFVFTIPGTVGFFGKLGFPAALAYGTIAIEIIGGLMLIAGLFSRWVALAAIPVLIGATWVHLGNGWVFSAAGGGWEFPAFWTVVLAVQALLGDGAYALRPNLRSGRPAGLATTG